MNPEVDGRDAAEEFRDRHGLGLLPLGDLVTLIEQTTGVDVAVLDVHASEHGMTICDPTLGTTIIGVARTPHPMRQRSTLAHELAHVLFEDADRPVWTTTWSASDEAEERARAFARHLLIPQQGLLPPPRTNGAFDAQDLSHLVQRYLVSPPLALVALRQRGVVTAEEASRLGRINTPDLATRFGWMDRYRQLQANSDSSRAPQLLLARAIAGYQAGVLGAGAIARLRGITVEVVEQELRAAGIVPDSLDFSDDPMPLGAVLDDAELDEMLGNGSEPTS